MARIPLARNVKIMLRPYDDTYRKQKHLVYTNNKKLVSIRAKLSCTLELRAFSFRLSVRSYLPYLLTLPVRARASRPRTSTSITYTYMDRLVILLERISSDKIVLHSDILSVGRLLVKAQPSATVYINITKLRAVFFQLLCPLTNMPRSLFSSYNE